VLLRDRAPRVAVEKEKQLMPWKSILVSLVISALLPAGCLAGDAQAVNTAVARRVYEEGLSKGKFEVPYTESFVGHGGAGTFTHEDGLREARGWRAAFPDLHVSVDLTVAQDDLVSVRWTARGTNTGAGNGIPATGKSVVVRGTTIFRFVDGRIAEEWTSGDSLGMLKQLGLFPGLSAPSTASSR
jgi:steroid delta-isomerase-like uncharacterized protein